MSLNRTILCRHKDYLHLNIEIDFSHLWEGGPEELDDKSRTSWGGQFRGRPKLSDQLINTLRELSHKEKPKVLKGRMSNLRTFYRFLDAYEVWSKSNNDKKFSCSVNMLEDITTHHLQMWKTPAPNG
jgi:hypothetical protein